MYTAIMVHVENHMLLKIMISQNKISSSFTNKHPTEFHLAPNTLTNIDINI